MFQVWYQVSTAEATRWGKSVFLPGTVLSYRVTGMLEGEVYHFSVRGVNSEGAGHFSEVVLAGGSVASPGRPLPGKPGRSVDGVAILFV